MQDQSSGEPSFIFLHKFTGLTQAKRGAKLVSPAFVDSDRERWQVSLYPTGDAEVRDPLTGSTRTTTMLLYCCIMCMCCAHGREQRKRVREGRPVASHGLRT